ncbi:MAG: SCO family protein [Verrucomicrobia bacterium]|nr:SCO family protein [Verrucomicrobiota bacterium]
MTTASDTSKRECCHTLAAPGSVADRSIYELDAAWETDAGQPTMLISLAGKPQIVAMFYASCHVTCPITLQCVKQLESSLPADLRSRVGFVLVTLDPQSDTTPVLHTFRRDQQLSDRWVLLRGNGLATRNLARSLGVAFERDNYRLAHSTQIALLDRNGKLACRQIDLHESPKRLLAAVKTAVALP